MDPVRNPYNPGAGNPPTELAGRDRELDHFDVAVQRLGLGRHAKSWLLTGLRGVGKTVLLREFGRIAEGHGWIHDQVEATDDTSLREVVASVGRRTLLRLSTRERLKDRARKALGLLSAFKVRYQIPDTTTTVTGEIDVLAGWADTGILSDDLAEVFIEVGRIARQDGTGVLVTIDEMQYLSRDDLADLIIGLHRVSQEQLPFMIAGAGLPSLPGLAGEAKSYAERLFDFAEVGSLPADDARVALSLPAQAEGVSWTPEALNRVFDLTQGYPYFLQEFGKQAWNTAEDSEVIDIDDVERAGPVVADELDTGFFRARLDRANNSERRYLRAMAGFGPVPCVSSDVAEAMGKTTTQVGPIRDALIKRGLIYSPRWGEVAFTVPMFDEYVARTFR